MVKKIKIDKDILVLIDELQAKIKSNKDEIENLALRNNDHMKTTWSIIKEKYPETQQNENISVNYKTGIILLWDSDSDKLLCGISELKTQAIHSGKYELAAELRSLERKIISENK
jgi:hypothetical protein